MILPYQVKALLLSFAMAIVAVAFWCESVRNGSHGPWTYVVMVVMVLGAFLVVHFVVRGMKKVLAVSSMTIGIYLILSFATGLISSDDAHFLLSLALFISGAAVFLFGIGLMGGIDYNILRIRYISALLFAGLALALFSDLVFLKDPVLWIQRVWLRLSVALLALATLVASSDPTLGTVKMASSIRASVKAITGRMRTIRDAYLLRDDAERLASAIGRDGAREEAVLRSVGSGDRAIAVSASGGRTVVEIASGERVYADPVVSMEASSVHLGDGAAVFYGAEGRRIKVLVRDEVQEDFANPKIFDREIDTRKLWAGLWRTDGRKRS